MAGRRADIGSAARRPRSNSASARPGRRAGIPLPTVVVAANGQPLHDAAGLRALVRRLPVGTPVTYTFRRGDEVIPVSVPTTVLRWRDVVPGYAGYVIDGLAFETIVGNTVEACGTSATIDLHARGEDSGGHVVITIADNGPGIPPGALSRVFDLFYATKSSGTGVGLAMAKRLVERQGGTIEAHNAPGGGAVFTIQLPGAAPATVRTG